MGIEMPAEYYDDKIPKDLEPGWVRLYNIVSGILLAYRRDLAILDLGCGHGRLAQYLSAYGFTDYTGVDFSGKCVEIAKAVNPSFKFIHADIFTDEVMGMIKDYHAVILTEVLEHVEGDMDILMVIPRGALVIISVPNADDESHYRHFEQPEKVLDRYGRVIDIELFASLMVNDKGKMFYICAGRKK